MGSAPTITAEEAARAVYIDFEGGQDRAPSFIGIRTINWDGDVFDQVILEESLVPMLALSSAKNHTWPKAYQRVESGRSLSVTPRRRAEEFGHMVADLIDAADADDLLILS